MKNRYFPFLTLSLCLSLFSTAHSQIPERGFYKDIYMDGGLSLTSKQYLPSARSLMLSIETLRTGTKSLGITDVDTLLQNALLVGNEFDTNGILLYPDGAPRYRMVYVNGGTAKSHGRSLTPEGRERFRAFVKAGGGYLGSCAGAYLACEGTHGNPHYEEYLGIYPGICTNAQLQNKRVCVTVPADSPLLRYSDFGGDLHIDSVYHNGGCYMDYADLIPGAEILLQYDYPPKSMHGNGCVWSYKADEQTGRVMACGPHPEGIVSGERLDMMEAMVQYVLEGTPQPRIKASLTKGEPRLMSCKTEDNDPAHTRIGDKQYHHFTVEVPEGCDTLKIKLSSLEGYQNYDLFLFASYEGLAMLGSSKYKSVGQGLDKELVILAPKAGTLFLSVFCDTTVESEEARYGTMYTGRLDVLNGVPYQILVE